MDDELDLSEEEIKFIKKFLQYFFYFYTCSFMIVELWYFDFNLSKKSFSIVIMGVSGIVLIYISAYLDSFIDIEKWLSKLKKWFL